MLKTLITQWFPNASQERRNMAKELSSSFTKPDKVLKSPMSQGSKKSCQFEQHKAGEDYKKMTSGFENIKGREENLERDG